ncbi:MAG TPA: dienelactone hydrolase family protein [Acidimicrobiales bacterium]|nr:dienelactone hydrolase family protein [Acidimicrobiales bacterium]
MRIELPSGTPAELIRPSGEPSLGVVVAPDIFGLRPLFVDLCTTLAEQNSWVVCCAEPFPGRSLDGVDERFAAVRTLDDSHVLGDLVAAGNATECERVGLIGFCMGGMYALKAAGLSHFHRVVAFYGMIRIPEAWKGMGAAEPLDRVAGPLASPTLAIVGGQDPYTPPEDVAALEQTRVTVVQYPEADHGFVHDPDRPSHRAADAADAWQRAIAFLNS